MRQTGKCYCGDKRDKTNTVENSTEEPVFWAYSVKKNSNMKPLDLYIAAKSHYIHHVNSGASSLHIQWILLLTDS